MRILITGAAGMLGQDLQTAVAQAGHEAAALARSDLDVADASAVQTVIAATAPEVVINCAAWTDVDGAQADYEGALAVNGVAAGEVARASAQVGAWTIHVSSDYVFAGTKLEPYVESDLVGPQSAYGRSKLEGELAVARAAPDRHTIVRSSWLFGAGGACFPTTILRLGTEREKLMVVEDQIGCPTFTGHLAVALLELAQRGETAPVGVLHVAGGGECSWFQFAQEIVTRAGVRCEVVPVSTAEFPRPAPRPAYSVLRSERGTEAAALPDWDQGLDEYLTRTAEGAPR